MKKIIFTICLLFLVVGPSVALAIEYAEEPTVTLEIPFGKTGTSVTGLGEYIQLFYEFIVILIAIAAVVMLMFGGFKWATAAGNAGQVGSAKTTITNALIGLVLALTSFLLLYTINPALVSLDTFKIPYIEMQEDVGNFCNDPAELEEGRIVKDSKGKDYDPNNGFLCLNEYSIDGAQCFGNICPGSHYCLPSSSPSIKYDCIWHSKSQIEEQCNSITKSSLEKSKYYSSDGGICNEFTGLLTQETTLWGKCVWVPESVNAKCQWCSNDDFDSFKEKQQNVIDKHHQQVLDGERDEAEAYKKAEACSILWGQLGAATTAWTKFIQDLVSLNSTYACYVRWCNE